MHRRRRDKGVILVKILVVFFLYQRRITRLDEPRQIFLYSLCYASLVYKDEYKTRNASRRANFCNASFKTHYGK